MRQRIIKCRGGEVKLWYWVVYGWLGGGLEIMV